jgi:membrane protease YdiL (CAAX protease family)
MSGMRKAVVVLAAFAATLLTYRVLSLVPLYRELHRALPFYITESFMNLCEIALCIGAFLLLGERRIARALGIDRRILPALAFGIACSAPMLVGFALAHRSDVRDPLAVVFLAFVFPFAEEVVARGFAFRTLRRLGWPLWTAAAACAMLTGLAHIEKGQTAASILGLFFVTGAGGFTFCWLLDRWQSLWFPFALHACMNFWWEVFNVAPTALGGWYSLALQIGSIVLAILVTLRYTKSPSRLQPVGEDRLRDRLELHVRRALVDLSDLRVAPVLLDRVLLRVAVSAEELHRQ